MDVDLTDGHIDLGYADMNIPGRGPNLGRVRDGLSGHPDVPEGELVRDDRAPA